MIHDRQAQLEKAMRDFYTVVCFPEGGNPDWDAMKAIFCPWARLTRITPEGIDAMDMQGFIDMFSELIESGAITGFYEVETNRRVEFFGSVAHVLSAYVTKCSPKATKALAQGLNSMQLIWMNGKWMISSLLWDEGSRKSPVVLTRFQHEEIIYA
jgi:hypothetical protein